MRRHSSTEAPPAKTLAQIAASIPAAQWQSAQWKNAGGKSGATRLAWCEVWQQHALRKAGGELEKLWLVVDWPHDSTEPYHCYLANLNRPPTKARCLTLSRSRWHIEQYFQRAKDVLGLDHFEGRSWTGFHHQLAFRHLPIGLASQYTHASKKSGVTWAPALRSNRPSLVRSTGFCFCCVSKFSDIVSDST